MPILKTQQDVRKLQKLLFCYLCGQNFLPNDEKNRDHAPCQLCFAKEDRNFPLILPTHKTCNHDYSMIDEKIGQIISLKHSSFPSKPKIRFSFLKSLSGNDLCAIVNTDIRGAIWRWVRGFHAALYQEYLPLDTLLAIETPFPEAKETLEGTHFIALRKLQHVNFVQSIKEFRLTGTIDKIISNNQKLLYECSWTSADNGVWICVFALSLYDWKDLGDIYNFPARGCAGMYSLENGNLPKLATVGRHPSLFIPTYQKLDPFGK